ncbi:hypothetical protein A2U01_0051575, partial [Trifolium medium]|nr:hypothetical protein [Trifolium medium]
QKSNSEVILTPRWIPSRHDERKLNCQVYVLPKQEISSIVPTLGSSWHDRTNVGIIAARWATMVYDGKA